MSSSQQELVDFSTLLSSLRSGQVVELDPRGQSSCRDIPQATFDALQDPADFPPLEAAIVPGDRVALAVDPNVPSVSQVVLGAIKALGQTTAGAIDIVIGDEARLETVAAIRDVADGQANVIVHHSSDRDALRYLAADDAADPIYINRHLVDADFVLPIVVGRPSDTEWQSDLTGVYPAFADSASRSRHQTAQPTKDGEDRSVPQTAWLLGVHIVVSVQATADGSIAKVVAGTPEAVCHELQQLSARSEKLQALPSMLVISLDGDRQQQTWCNAARAIAAATRHVEPGSVVVLWSKIDSAIRANLQDSDDHDHDVAEIEQSGDGFPLWNEASSAAATIQRVATDHRLLIHCQVRPRIDRIDGSGIHWFG